MMKMLMAMLILPLRSRSLVTGGYKGEDEPDVICDSCTEDQFTKNRRTVIQVVD